MMIRVLVVFTVALIMVGCRTLTTPLFPSTTSQLEAKNDCIFVVEARDIPQQSISEEQCNPLFWLDYWSSNAKIPWPERKQLVAQTDKSPVGQLQLFILSQPLDTPYQTRLRAQSIFTALSPELAPYFQGLLHELAYIPSQKLLEYESAITVLSQVNTRQNQQIKEQAQLLQEQAEKLDQLLNIEAAILEKSSER
ncbi:hypothetical protein [Alteromonas flava]|uniref:hypothetical protein n=1 Tax=Alteromonas flava TaxID=2048003 RepID=UPI000F5E4FC9|nr:hypothetical protein [Alteromonas flava]